MRCARHRTTLCRMSCAATCVARARLASRRTAARMRALGLHRACSARRRSATGKPKRPLELAREALGARASSRAARRRAQRAARPPAAPAATPSTSAAIAAKRSRLRRAAIGGSGCAMRELGLADGDADAPRAEIEREHGAAVAVRRATRHACPPRRTGARSRCRAAASRRAAAPRRAVSNMTRRFASTVSQAFCASSCSSCPADQPA